MRTCVVIGLGTTAVKGTRLQSVSEIELTPSGARGNRRFFVVDERDRMVNAKVLGDLQTVVSECPGNELRLTFPDGRVTAAELSYGESVDASFFSRTVAGRLLDGPWSAALSEHVGRPVSLVEAPDGAVDRGPRGAVSLISRASLARLAEAAGEPSVDARRFRMLIEVDGVGPHAEDAWVGREARVGDASILFTGHVGRCLITSRDPDTGVIDLPTLDIIDSYRGEIDTTEPLPFGIFGEVRRQGRVRVGDVVELSS